MACMMTALRQLARPAPYAGPAVWRSFSAKLWRVRLRIELAVEQLADSSSALLGDAPGPVELARLVPARNEPEVGAR